MTHHACKTASIYINFVLDKEIKCTGSAWKIYTNMTRGSRGDRQVYPITTSTEEVENNYK